MDLNWTNHLSSLEEKEQFEKEVYGSKRVLNRLSQIMKNNESSLEAQELSTKAYDNPNWEYRQADANGFKRCLRMYQRILDLDKRILTPNE